MRLDVLGSCGGFPAPGRACSGYLLQSGDTRLWLDAGSGSLERLMRSTSLRDVDGVFITHLHPDHWTDLPLAVHALRLSEQRMGRPLAIHGPPGWVDDTGINMRWRLEDDDPVFVPFELADGEVMEVGGVVVEPRSVAHPVPTFGLRILDPAAGEAFAYSADSAPCEALVELAAGSRLFLCESGAPPGVQSRLHLNPEQAGGIAREAGAKHLVLTHLRPDADMPHHLAIAADVFPGDVSVALEGDSFET